MVYGYNFTKSILSRLLSALHEVMLMLINVEIHMHQYTVCKLRHITEVLYTLHIIAGATATLSASVVECH